ncbi:MAG: fructosamine kinase family protein [Mariprofundaceae bacterium]
MLMNDALRHCIEQHISASEISFCSERFSSEKFRSEKCSSVSGGSISRAWRMNGGGRSFFVKTNATEHGDMFATEYAGLQALAATNAVRVPRPVCYGEAGNTAYLVCEWLNLSSTSSCCGESLGRQLAALHKQSIGFDAINQYGWHHNNSIGSTPQVNTPDDDWSVFWQRRRLGFQLELAANNGFGGNLQLKGERLIEKVNVLLAGHQPQASLLHGDLWAGNWGVDEEGAPVLFDPAVYCGDREADLGMTELFGGFPEAFYAAYEEVWPLDGGYKMRKVLYNLYCILNHANLFGGAYVAQAEKMMDSLLAEAG